jgi:hypothetical protein
MQTSTPDRDGTAVHPYTQLAAINVNDKTEKKNGLTYLSWAWAVDQLLRADPQASWEYAEPKVFGGNTMMVFCTVTAFGKRMTAQLPVMNHKNQPIADPDSFQINVAMQRCLAKAIALHGLGLYIYSGEDVPPEEPKAEPPAPKVTEARIKEMKAALTACKGKAELRETFKALEPVEQTVVKEFVTALARSLSE